MRGADMVLEPEEVERFYRIWFPLLRYTNEKRHVVPEIHAWPPEASLDVQDAMALRNILWADDSLLDGFIDENPAALPPEDLALARSWHHRRFGDLYVFRYLKKYTVFLDTGEPPHAYGVLGLSSSFEDALGPTLPRLVTTALLPFEDRIVYDGLLAGPNLFFGSNIKRDLNAIYRRVKEREGITTSLVPRTPARPEEELEDVRERNARVLGEFRKWLSGRLNAATVDRHVAAVEEFAEAYLLAQHPPRLLLDLTPEGVDAYLSARVAAVGKGRAPINSFERFVKFLYDTDRIDPALAGDLWTRVRGLRR